MYQKNTKLEILRQKFFNDVRNSLGRGFSSPYTKALMCKLLYNLFHTKSYYIDPGFLKILTKQKTYALVLAIYSFLSESGETTFDELYEKISHHLKNLALCGIPLPPSIGESTNQEKSVLEYSPSPHQVKRALKILCNAGLIIKSENIYKIADKKPDYVEDMERRLWASYEEYVKKFEMLVKNSEGVKVQLFMGPPGAGKGTIGEDESGDEVIRVEMGSTFRNLAKTWKNLERLDMIINRSKEEGYFEDVKTLLDDEINNLLRTVKEIGVKGESPEEVKKHLQNVIKNMNKGLLASHGDFDFVKSVTRVVVNKVKPSEIDSCKSIIIDGYPRDKKQVEDLPLLSEKLQEIYGVPLTMYGINVIPGLNHKELIKRMENRKRDNETEEVIMRRLNTYASDTLTALESMVDSRAPLIIIVNNEKEKIPFLASFLHDLFS